MKDLSHLNTTSVCFDLRAHGNSTGQYTTFGFSEVHDLEAIVQFIKNNKKYKNLPLYLLGVSCGGAVVLHALFRRIKPQGVILDSVFACFNDLPIWNKMWWMNKALLK